MEKMRSAAVLAILGIVIAMIEALLYQAFWNLLWPILSKDKTPDEIETLTHVADFLQSCLWALAIALLIAAAVVGRKSAPTS
jgi:hypothetical protein